MRPFASSPNRRRVSAAWSQTAESLAASAPRLAILPAREKIVSATLSSAVSWSKRFTSWKLRAIPALMRPCTDWWVTSAPRNRIWPLSGRKSPEIRLTSVVLPAPFEPIRARTSLSLTVKLTWSTACVSPNHFTRSFVTRRLTSVSPLEPREQAPGGSDDPGGQRQHQPHQHGAEQQLPVDRVADRVRLEIVEHDGSDDRPGERAEPAEDRHEHDLARERPVHDVGRREPVQRTPEGARQPREDAGHQERHPTVPPDPHAHELGPGLVVADRLERHPEGRVHDHPHQRDAQTEHDEHVVVVRVRHEDRLVPRARHEPAEERRRRHAQPVGPARHPEELEGERPEHLREGQREDAEEDRRVADADDAEERGDEDRGDDGADQEQLHGADLEVLDHQRHRV